MAKRRMGIFGFLMCVCLCLAPCCARAASTANAAEPISPERACTLTVSYVYEGTALSDLPVNLYKIADVSADYQYTLTSSFLSSGLALNGIQTNAEWNVVRSTLEAHIVANGISSDMAAVTDQNGRICFASLKPGLYLAVPGIGTSGELQCAFESALIAVPGLGADERWQYQIAVTAKGTPIPPADTTPDISYKILKLWKGDSGNSSRPPEIEVEIFRNGESYRTVILSNSNHWSYTWSAKDDGTNWMVVERNVPSGYTATLEKRAATFILTNTLTPDTPPTPNTPPTPDTPPPSTPSTEDKLPQTGYTSTIMLSAMLMYAAGIFLVLMGIIQKKKYV